ncbi:T9SS type A sorting domain-containing protein [Lewinella sp. LCG006]|uniref:T9SS type A sorting domain-containing protein n=1 Tax=Lewinella sp. LCG006 TaxID=3231911 RepID=UPI00346079A4
MKNQKNLKSFIVEILISYLLFFITPLSLLGQSSSLNINIFPPNEIIDFDQQGVNGFDIDYQLFGSQSGAGAASAIITYYYCNSNNTVCRFIDDRTVTLGCNSGLCIPQGGQQTHYIARTQLPPDFEETCFSGDHYIVAVLTRNTGTQVLNTNPTAPVVFAHSKPDFIPLNVTVAPNPNIPGQAVITCTIINNGVCPGSTQATVWLTPDAGAPILFNVPFENVGVPVTVSVTIDDLDIGTFYDATLTVDVYNNSMESNETNNVLTLNNVYVVPIPMEIESFVPSSALVNSVITITGTSGFTTQGDFLDVYRAFLGGTEIEIVATSEDEMQVRIPYYEMTDFITLQTIYGTTVVSSNEFTILCSPDFADIENGTIPFPWDTENPDNDLSFQVYSSGGANGSAKSILMNHWIYPTIGALDFIIIPHVCVDNSPEWYLQFDVAYTYYDDGNISFVDNLIIGDLSTGDIIDFINGEELATAPAQATFFEPSTDDWVTREIPLSSLINNGQRELYLTLVTQNGNGNAMYLDNIRVANFSILPVEYASIKATPAGNTIEVHWSTVTESGNAYFIVETSTDGRTFTQIGTVAGAGTSSTLQNYLFTDYTPEPGLNYYRLLQVDFDGQEAYSEIVSATYNTGRDYVEIAPNPGNGYLSINSSLEDDLIVQILDYSGRVINRIDNFTGPYLDLSNLPDGIYVLQVTNGVSWYSFKYLKQAG